MGTRLRLFIAGRGGEGLGKGHFYEALEECLRSPSDTNFCRVRRPEAGLMWDICRDKDAGQLAGGSGERARGDRKEAVSIGR